MSHPLEIPSIKAVTGGVSGLVPSLVVPVAPSTVDNRSGVSYLYLVVLAVFAAIWMRKRFLRDGNAGETFRFQTAMGLDGVDTDEVSIGTVIKGLKVPFTLFAVLFCLFRSIPFVSMGMITYKHIEWLRLTVALSGVYFATEGFMAIFVDYLLIIVQGVDVPRIFYQILKIFVFILIGLPVMSTEFGLDITPFLTTSAVLTMVIGLALQDSLGNLFSGIAMQVSNPFKVGDWVLLGGSEGRIREVNWRATTIKTFSNDFLILPNSTISKAEIKNFSRPTKVHARFVEIGLSYSDSPEKVRNMLYEATISVDGVLPRPAPQVMLVKFNDFTIDYVIKFFILDYSKYPGIESDLKVSIWYALKRACMEVPFPVRTIEYAKAENTEEEMNTRYDLLVAVDFLQAISDSGLRELVGLLRPEIYPPGYKIVSEGEQGQTFYIIRSGSAEILVPSSERDSDEEVQVAVLERSQYFGEMSLLTGEKRNATVKTLSEVETLSLDKEAFRAILRKEPKLAERISSIIVSRRQGIEDALQKSKGPGNRTRISKDAEAGHRKQEIERQNLLKKIVLFFGM